MAAAYYQASFVNFLEESTESILGKIVQSHVFALEQTQRDAWIDEITIMKSAVRDLGLGHILFEFFIPRMGKRADVVVVQATTVTVVEFKVGSYLFDRAAIEQVHDYALDLKNFHQGSHHCPIIPVLVATKAKPSRQQSLRWATDQVAAPILASVEQLKDLLSEIGQGAETHCIDYAAWVASGYRPTPTIVEAAQALYQAHGVEEIARSDSGAENLGITSQCIAQIIEKSKGSCRKSICLLTGVPGAGKTLAGLNIATKRMQEHGDEHAVFLSGNGPLVSVLREALARDQSSREKISKTDAHRKVASFIQNIHHFRDDAIENLNPPVEHVVVFDEAQRAWTREQTSKFMQKKKPVKDFDMSEPEFLISVMDRHPDWCVIVCLIGEGQEINTGEAGLAEWLSALESRFSNWDVYISNRLKDPDYVNDLPIVQLLENMAVSECSELHLSVSMRSFRAEALSAFVSHVIDNRAQDARATYAEIAEHYPILLTRDLAAARLWLQRQARGSERYGLLASSGAHRLRPEGIHVSAKIDAPVWFLNDRTDVRSAFYCEETATEFDVQGLEVDWAAVCWDADYRYSNGCWENMNFRGTQWQKVKSIQRQLYLRNAYRVLLTRARQGMVIFVPQGDVGDPTRLPSFYNETFAFLQACGLNLLSEAEAMSPVIPAQ